MRVEFNTGEKLKNHEKLERKYLGATLHLMGQSLSLGF
jgi:hypothetical protein